MKALHIHRRRLLAALLLVIIPALLYLPALYYSLDTPFALVDDYSERWFIQQYDDWDRFHAPLLQDEVLDTRDRYRPFRAVYTLAAWVIYGDNPWLHHLGRWALHFGAALMFAAAFYRIANKCTGGG